MKIVIDIPEDLYEGIERRDGALETEYVCDELMKSVDKGTPLPKGHGRLIDADELLKHSYRIDDSATLSTRDVVNEEEIDDAPTIIEAESERYKNREDKDNMFGVGVSITMGTKEYGRKELERIGYFKESDDPYNDMVANAILELLETFDNQGHSGFTAPYTARMFHRLVMFKPITPLTGEDDEWEEIESGCFQNKRYSAVFKGEDGKAYNIEGKIFSDDGGDVWFTNRDSKVYIEFPYTVPEHPEKIILNQKEE